MRSRHGKTPPVSFSLSNLSPVGTADKLRRSIFILVSSLCLLHTYLLTIQFNSVNAMFFVQGINTMYLVLPCSAVSH